METSWKRYETSCNMFKKNGMRDAERFESKGEDLAVTDAVLFLIWGEALKQRWNPPLCFRAHNSSQELFVGNVAWKSFRLRVSEPFSNRGQVWGPCFYLDMSRSFVKISAGQSHGVCFIRCLLHSDYGLSRVGEKPAPAWVIDVTDAMAMALWHQWIFDLSQLRLRTGFWWRVMLSANITKQQQVSDMLWFLDTSPRDADSFPLSKSCLDVELTRVERLNVAETEMIYEATEIAFVPYSRS